MKNIYEKKKRTSIKKHLLRFFFGCFSIANAESPFFLGTTQTKHLLLFTDNLIKIPSYYLSILQWPGSQHAFTYISSSDGRWGQRQWREKRWNNSCEWNNKFLQNWLVYYLYYDIFLQILQCFPSSKFRARSWRRAPLSVPGTSESL